MCTTLDKVIVKHHQLFSAFCQCFYSYN